MSFFACRVTIQIYFLEILAFSQSFGRCDWNKYKTHKELKAEEKNEIETIKETSAKDYAENPLNEADKDDEIVDVIIDEDGSIITVDFS